ncbi:MAG: DUF5069 domain-containing protein [Gemmatimonadetes bacterium]|jgi:hypothetical protein|nr:DUF5069 domain-containing protein [Gemmatimonadota bacterium]
MDTHVPLISTRSKGPLGLVHLPRLWLKMRLAAKSKLAEGYHAGKGGADVALLNTLGLDSDATAAFVAESQPTYLAFEAWIKENVEPERLTSEAIDRFNERVLSFPKPEPERSEILGLLGLPKDDTEWISSDLNDLDDWHGFHLALIDV